LDWLAKAGLALGQKKLFFWLHWLAKAGLAL
jgi:hypothetical protein